MDRRNYNIWDAGSDGEEDEEAMLAAALAMSMGDVAGSAAAPPPPPPSAPMARQWSSTDPIYRISAAKRSVRKWRRHRRRRKDEAAGVKEDDVPPPPAHGPSMARQWSTPDPLYRIAAAKRSLRKWKGHRRLAAKGQLLLARALSSEEPRCVLRLRGAVKGSLDVELACTISQVKRIIQRSYEEVENSAIQLVSNGKKLSDDDTVSACGLTEGSKLLVMATPVAAASAAPAAAVAAVEEAPRQPCKAGCGFFGSAAFSGYCSACFRTYAPPPPTVAPPPTAAAAAEAAAAAGGKKETKKKKKKKKKKSKKRCGVCRHKLRLTDMACRCGVRFCDSHRLPEHHDCEFDWKQAGRRGLEEDMGESAAFDVLRDRL